jgi:DNA processing protein
MNPLPSPALVGWVALCLIPGIGGRTMSLLLDTFGSASAVFEAAPSDFKGLGRLNAKTIEAIAAIDLEAVQVQIILWQTQGIHLINWQDGHYPPPLLTLPDRPPLLFAKGQVDQQWEKVLAIVGSREPDVTSIHLAESLGWTIISGLARGIDAAGHRGALQTGRTVAMVGCGVDELYPIQNRILAHKILAQGAIYAEVPPKTLPSAGMLMARNRLIASCAKATIVVQAGLYSGSMEAARRARISGRHVLTVDHQAYEGNQALLRMEAIPLEPEFKDWDGLAELLAALPDPPKQLELFE